MLPVSALILFALFFVLFLGSILVLIPVFTGAKGPHNEEKSVTYECGLEESRGLDTKVAVQFHLVAILFILFDVEVVFMYPWAIAFKQGVLEGQGLYMAGAMGFFIFIFLLGLVWEIKAKALDWNR